MDQTPASLVPTGTGQVSGTSHCHYKKQTSFRTSLEWCRPRTWPLTNFQHCKRLRHAALRPVIRLEPLFHFGIHSGIKARCIREFRMLMTYNSGSKRWFFVFKLLLIQIWISCWNSWKRNFLYNWCEIIHQKDVPYHTELHRSENRQYRGDHYSHLSPLTCQLKIPPDHPFWWVTQRASAV